MRTRKALRRAREKRVRFAGARASFVCKRGALACAWADDPPRIDRETAPSWRGTVLAAAGDMARIFTPGTWVAVAMLSALGVACSDNPFPPKASDGEDEGTGSIVAPAPTGASSATTMTSASREVCGNGLDDDANGQVDEGCPCTPGLTQKCYGGSARLAGIGACTMGTQTCIATGTGEIKSTAWGPCTGSGVPSAEKCDGVDNDCNGKADDTCGGPGPGGADAGQPIPPGAVPCQGSGLVFTSIGDKCIDDGGQSAEDDDLQVFCVNNIARFCLSKEACPWRDGLPTANDVTCSTAGLNSNYFASARSACGDWQGHPRICCSANGHASFSGC